MSDIVDKVSSLENLVITEFNRTPLPGLMVGVVHDGKPIYQKAFGYANLEKDVPVNDETIFRIMSISKTFTTIGALQLWEQGKFDLDEPINPFLKGLVVRHKDANAPEITFRHLMTHTSGIGEAPSIDYLFKMINGLGAKPDSRIISMNEYFRGRISPELHAEQRWSYSNNGFAVLAQLIEDISGQPFNYYMREHVLEPLGMLHSDYFMSERVRDNLAEGYVFKKDHFKPVGYTRLITPGCGGIFSNLQDMALYVSAIMNGGKNQHGTVIKTETLKMMMTDQLKSDPRAFRMGLGFFLEDFDGHQVVEHGGGWPGFISSMRVVPEDNLAALTFTNSSDGAPGRITQAVLQHLLGVEKPSKRMAKKRIKTPITNMAEYCGVYRPAKGFLNNTRIWLSFGGEFNVFQKDGKLRLKSLRGIFGKGIQLNRVDDDPLSFNYLQGYGYGERPVVFFRGADGCIAGVHVGEFVFYKQKPYQSLKVLAGAVLAAISALIILPITRLIKGRK